MKCRKKGLKIIGWFLFSVVITFMALSTFCLIWARRYYGNIGFEEIVFHLRIPIEGTSKRILLNFAKNCIFPTAVCMVIWFVLIIPCKGCKKTFRIPLSKKAHIQLYPFRLPTGVWLVLIAIWIIAMISLANYFWGFSKYVSNQIQTSTLIEEEYVDPGNVEIVFPKEKRNLICIWVESAETSTQDTEHGGVFEENYIKEMTDLALNNVSFSQSNQLEGAVVAPACGWTIAGLVAQTSGMPLKLGAYDDRGFDNSMGRYGSFLPGATTLGDILAEQGYQNYFVAGSDFNFGGRTKYFTQHGNYQIFDYYSAIEEGKISEDYYEWWGFEDEKLYAYSKEKLLELAEQEQPFNFSLLTVDTHHEDGYLCPNCPDTYDSQYANVWSCASRQLNDFVEWIKDQEFYDNTTIVILGDHCSMDSDFYEGYIYDKHHGTTERKVYNAFINAVPTPINEKDRLFTTMDYFPTILASIGVKIDGNRLGLGTNLFSEEKTLSEKYGYDKLFEELDKKSTFYNEELLFP